MQLSNFWRDVGQDWGIGRVYLPQEDMVQFGVAEADLAARRVTPAFVRLMEFEMVRAEEYYEHARAGVRRLVRGRWAVMAALEVYRAIHAGIRRNGYDVFRKRTTTTHLQKIGLAFHAARLLRA